MNKKHHSSRRSVIFHRHRQPLECPPKELKNSAGPLIETTAFVTVVNDWIWNFIYLFLKTLNLFFRKRFKFRRRKASFSTIVEKLIFRFWNGYQIILKNIKVGIFRGFEKTILESVKFGVQMVIYCYRKILFWSLPV